MTWLPQLAGGREAINLSVKASAALLRVVRLEGSRRSSYTL